MPGRWEQAHGRGAAGHRSGAGLTPFRTIAEAVSADGGELLEPVSALVDRAHAFAATQVNGTLTLQNWYAGRLFDVAVLREDRAGYVQESIASLAQHASRTHFRELHPFASDDAQAFYLRERIESHPSVSDPGPRRCSGHVSRRSITRRTSESPAGSSPQWRKKRLASRDWRALASASTATSRGL